MAQIDVAISTQAQDADLESLCKELSESLPKLPKQIKYLAMGNYSFFRAMSAKQWMRLLTNLPPNLIEFDISFNELHSVEPTILAKALPRIPQSVTCLNLSQNHLTRNGKSNLSTIINAIPDNILRIGFDGHFFERIDSQDFVDVLMGNNPWLYFALRHPFILSGGTGLMTSLSVLLLSTVFASSMSVLAVSTGISACAVTFFLCKQSVSLSRSKYIAQKEQTVPLDATQNIEDSQDNLSPIL